MSVPSSVVKQFAFDWIEENRKRLSDFDMEIWSYAEPAWREYKSARAYVNLLRSEGFTIEEGSGDMPTAFVARWENGDGPALGSFAEYDATPGMSQQAVPYEAPREGFHPRAAGHTDPHSMLGVAALTGILGAQKAMMKFGLRGSLTLIGEPAEKVCGSKPVHAAKGYLDGFDAFVLYHPAPTNTVVWDTHFGSYWSAVFTFEATAPETWGDKSLMPMGAHAHAAARAPGALDALCLMYTMTKHTKESMFPRSGTWTLNEFVLVAGDATADNLPPRFSQIQYSWRSPDLGIQERIYRVLENNARRAAAMAGCEVTVRWVTKTRVGLPNHSLATLAYRNMEMIGPPSYGEEALEFGRTIQRNLGLTPLGNPFLDSHTRLLPPQQYEAGLRENLPSWQKYFAADDYVEYCWHAPTARIRTARPMLRPPSPDYEYPAWATNAISGRPELIDPGMFLAGKTIAGTLLDLVTIPEELEKARSEFLERTGGGIGGAKWLPPLLPRDFVPPTDLRWPEYIRTDRGEEWWIPTPNRKAEIKL